MTVRGKIGVRRRSEPRGSVPSVSVTWMPHSPAGTMYPSRGIVLAVPISRGTRVLPPGAARNTFSGMPCAPEYPPTTSPVCGSTTATVTWPLVAIWSSLPDRLRTSRLCRKGVPRPDNSRAVQLNSDFPGVEQARERGGCQPGTRPSARRVRQRPDRQLDVVPELAAQFRRGGGSPGRQANPERRHRRHPARVQFQCRMPPQDVRLLIAQPDEYHLQLIPGRHTGILIRLGCRQAERDKT